jgi:hypothetical protein
VEPSKCFKVEPSSQKLEVLLSACPVCGRWLSLALLGIAALMGAPAAPSAILGTADNENGTARAEVMELKRLSGGMMMLRIGLINTSKEPMSMATSYTDSKTGDAFAFSGVSLVDSLNKKKYLVVRDSVSHCVCSEGLQDLKPGKPAIRRLLSRGRESQHPIRLPEPRRVSSA